MTPVDRLRYVFALTLPLIVGCRASPEAVEADLLALDHRWEKARIEQDTSALAELLADDFVHIDEKGELTGKKERLRRLAARSLAALPGQADEYRIRAYNGAAVMTHRSMEAGQASRSTHVFVRRDGRWQVVAHHSSLIVTDR